MPIIAPSADMAEPMGDWDPNNPDKQRRFSSVATPVIRTGQRDVAVDRVAYDDLATTSRPGLMSAADKTLMVPASTSRPGYMTAADKALMVPAESFVNFSNPGKNGLMTAADKAKADCIILEGERETGAIAARIVRADALEDMLGDRTLLNDMALKINGRTRGETHAVGPVWNTPAAIEYYIDASAGNDSTGDGTAAKPFATIFQAIEHYKKTFPGHVRTLILRIGSGTYASPFTDSVQSTLGISYDFLDVIGTNDDTTKAGASKTVLDGGTKPAIRQVIADSGQIRLTSITAKSSGTSSALTVQGSNHTLTTSGYIGVISDGNVVGNGVLVTLNASHYNLGHFTFIGNFYNAYSLDNGGRNTGFASGRIFSHYSGSLERIIVCIYASKGFFNMGAARFIYGNDSTGNAAVFVDFTSELYVAAGPAASRTGTYSANAVRGGFLYPTNLFI